MLLKKWFLIIGGILCIAVSTNAQNQSFQINDTGVSITGDNGADNYSATYSEAITEYLIAAISMIPNRDGSNRVVYIVDPASATRKVKFEIGGNELFIYHSSGVDDVIIRAKANYGGIDVGKISLSATADVDEKMKFDYQVGVLLKAFFESFDPISDVINITGGVVTYSGQQ